MPRLENVRSDSVFFIELLWTLYMSSQHTGSARQVHFSPKKHWVYSVQCWSLKIILALWWHYPHSTEDETRFQWGEVKIHQPRPPESQPDGNHSSGRGAANHPQEQQQPHHCNTPSRRDWAPGEGHAVLFSRGIRPAFHSSGIMASLWIIRVLF